jgi:hypothetical protein
MESGGTLRVLDLLFVVSDPQTGELAAIGVPSSGAGLPVSRLVGFRLDPAERSRATSRALRPSTGRIAPDTLDRIGRTLEPGAALAAVLVEHVWADALQDAVERTGGSRLAEPFVDALTLAELEPELLDAAGRRSDG